MLHQAHYVIHVKRVSRSARVARVKGPAPVAVLLEVRISAFLCPLVFARPLPPIAVRALLEFPYRAGTGPEYPRWSKQLTEWAAP